MDTELKALRTRLPRLRLAFSGASERIVAKLKMPVAPNFDAISAVMEKLRRENPPLNLLKVPERKPRPQMNNYLAKALGLDMSSLALGKAAEFDPIAFVSPEEKAKYHEKLEAFYATYQDYLERQIEWRNARQRTIKIQLEVRNEGLAPAEEVVVKMHFPDGFQLCGKGELTPEPTPPSAPEKPFPFGEPRLLHSGFLVPELRRPQLDPSVFTKSNVSGNSIRQTRSYDVETRVTKINHGFNEHLDPMFATFHSYEGAKSFVISYEIHAANLPVPERGELHVVIERFQPDNSS
jgi:hypothetical protein